MWSRESERNSLRAFERSLAFGFGIETDIRDLSGRLVISHDPPVHETLTLDSLLSLFANKQDSWPVLALNVKSDGLQSAFHRLIGEFTETNYFVFDMAVPDALAWIKTGAPTFTRHSEVEPVPAFYDQAAGVWLDGFFSEWWADDVILAHHKAGKKVCIVSSELHGRDPTALWDRLSSSKFRTAAGLMLCTDRPLEARALFGA